MTDDQDEGQRPPRRLTPMEGADVLAHYLELRRQQLIIEIRMIEEMLGMPLSIPKRQR